MSQSKHKFKCNVIRELTVLMKNLRTNNPAFQLEYTKQFRAFLEDKTKMSVNRMHYVSKKIIQKDFASRFLAFVQNNHFPELQFEALWIILEIAADSDECTAYLVRIGSFDVLIDLLRSPAAYQILNGKQYSIVGLSLWALANIIAQRPLRDKLLNHKQLLPNMLAICSSQFDGQLAVSQFHNHDVLCAMAFLLSNLCHNILPHTKQQLESIFKCIQNVLKQVLDHDIKQGALLKDICSALYNLTKCDGFYDEIIAMVQTQGIIQQMIRLMSHESLEIRKQMHRTMYIISLCIMCAPRWSTLDENVTILLLNQYHKVLTSKTCTESDSKEILWSLLFIDSHLILKCNLYPVLIETARSTSYSNSIVTALAVLYTITHMCQSYAIHVPPLCQCDLIPQLLTLLQQWIESESEERKPNTLQIYLKVIDKILTELGDGFTQHCKNIKEMQSHIFLQHVKWVDTDSQRLQEVLSSLHVGYNIDDTCTQTIYTILDKLCNVVIQYKFIQSIFLSNTNDTAPIVFDVLSVDSEISDKTALWIILNIAQEFNSNIFAKALAKLNIMQRIVNLLQSEVFDVRKQAACVLFNIFKRCHKIQQMSRMVKLSSVIPNLLSLFEFVLDTTFDAPFVLNLLETVHHLLGNMNDSWVIIKIMLRCSTIEVLESFQTILMERCDVFEDINMDVFDQKISTIRNILALHQKEEVFLIPCSATKCNLSKYTKSYALHVQINKFYRCKRCKSAVYCSVRCQKWHWKHGHKLQCIP
eukprot:181994_1